MHFVNFKLQICFPVHNCPFSNLLAANGLSKSFADGKSTGDSRFSGTMGCCHWRKIVTKHSRPGSFFLPTGNEAPQGARYSRQESIEVRLLVPKGLLSVRQNWKFVTLFFQHNSLFMCLNILCSRVSRKKCNIHNYKNNTYNDDYCKGYSYRFPYSFTLTISDCHLFSNMW